MTKPSYWELLRDPRWQKKRLEVMQRENFTCEECGDVSQTLNVHHSYYEKGKSPWEYPSESLHCLCETCHSEVEMERRELAQQIGRLDRASQRQLLGYAKALEIELEPATVHKVTEYEELVGMIRLFGMLSHHEIDRRAKVLIPLADELGKRVDGYVLLVAEETVRESVVQVAS
jgi:hypothetical protein